MMTTPRRMLPTGPPSSTPGTPTAAPRIASGSPPQRTRAPALPVGPPPVRAGPSSATPPAPHRQHVKLLPSTPPPGSRRNSDIPPSPAHAANAAPPDGHHSHPQHQLLMSDAPPFGSSNVDALVSGYVEFDEAFRYDKVAALPEPSLRKLHVGARDDVGRAAGVPLHLAASDVWVKLCEPSVPTAGLRLEFSLRTPSRIPSDVVRSLRSFFEETSRPVSFRFFRLCEEYLAAVDPNCPVATLAVDQAYVINAYDGYRVRPNPAAAEMNQTATSSAPHTPVHGARSASQHSAAGAAAVSSTPTAQQQRPLTPAEQAHARRASFFTPDRAFLDTPTAAPPLYPGLAGVVETPPRQSPSTPRTAPTAAGFISSGGGSSRPRGTPVLRPAPRQPPPPTRTQWAVGQQQQQQQQPSPAVREVRGRYYPDDGAVADTDDGYQSTGSSQKRYRLQPVASSSSHQDIGGGGGVRRPSSPGPSRSVQNGYTMMGGGGGGVQAREEQDGIEIYVPHATRTRSGPQRGVEVRQVNTVGDPNDYNNNNAGRIRDQNSDRSRYYVNAEY
eukprot:PhM_4_TR2722/c1_g1_i1/m.57764